MKKNAGRSVPFLVIYFFFATSYCCWAQSGTEVRKLGQKDKKRKEKYFCEVQGRGEDPKTRKRSTESTEMFKALLRLKWILTTT